MQNRLREVKKGLMIAAGAIFVALAMLGIVFPVLPTTPFLLLAAFLFAHSSDRAHNWLLNHRWFGPYIRNYREGRGMTARDKAITITSLWLGIGFSVVFALESPWPRLLLLAIACGVTFHLLRINTCLPEPRTSPARNAMEPD